MFPFEFREIFKYTFFKEHLRATSSGFRQFLCYISSKIVAGINKIISGIWFSKFAQSYLVSMRMFVLIKNIIHLKKTFQVNCSEILFLLSEAAI